MQQSYSFTRYLSAKKTVDDRALNRYVWNTMAAAVREATVKGNLRVLEVGAGIGTMVERVLERGALKQAEYTAIDAAPETIAEARRRLPRWATHNEFLMDTETRSRLRMCRGDQLLHLETEAIDVFDFIARERGRREWDLLIANAFLDLVDVPATLPQLFSLLRPGGFFYFTINFDGETIFEPTIERSLDARIVRLYHASMDARTVDGVSSGDSRTGRHLPGNLREAGADILAAGGSDWVVWPGPDGYIEDEAYFLHYMIDTIARELDDHPDLDAADFAAWIARRHAQVEREELTYIAHQLDFFGRVAGTSP